ncbi:MAG: hypothetical protein AW08_03146 [Candidatus Accumulibacter adjunctus]|uniref:Uncharacterized protein n=1 Tax=Candidatus Accumulibacter adjunctus TaxID=1454001 RepID=A0A011NM64_9PROT|nr:MAG: hypothetical protein AW08_03146 [Candidatus Accumulibacter adjunctus]
MASHRSHDPIFGLSNEWAYGAPSDRLLFPLLQAHLGRQGRRAPSNNRQSLGGPAASHQPHQPDADQQQGRRLRRACHDEGIVYILKDTGV